MTKRIFILNGMAQSGKDTFVTTLHKLGIETIHYSYVDFTRDMLENAGILTNKKTDKLRKLLCDVNNSLEEYDDIPFRDCCSIIENFIEGFIEGDWLLIDCREPKNIDRLKKCVDTNVETIFIKSNRICNASSADMAVSEEYEYDYYIDNTGTLSEFELNIEEFTRNLKLVK